MRYNLDSRASLRIRLMPTMARLEIGPLIFFPLPLMYLVLRRQKNKRVKCKKEGWGHSALVTHLLSIHMIPCLITNIRGKK
jgi:hypothetical protein